jgi:hypothetical protein
MLDSRYWMLDARYSEKTVSGDQLSVIVELVEKD